MNASQIEDNIFGIREREFTVYPGKVDIISIIFKKVMPISSSDWLIFYKTKKIHMYHNFRYKIFDVINFPYYQTHQNLQSKSFFYLRI